MKTVLKQYQNFSECVYYVQEDFHSSSLIVTPAQLVGAPPASYDRTTTLYLAFTAP